MKFHPLLKRPTNLIPLSYEKILFDRFNFRTSDSVNNNISQNSSIKSIFGNLNTHLSVKNEDSNQSLLNNHSHKAEKSLNFDINSLTKISQKETKNTSSLDTHYATDKQPNIFTSNEKIIENNKSSINTNDNIINDLSNSKDSEKKEELFRSNTKDSELSPVKYLSKLKETNSDRDFYNEEKGFVDLSNEQNNSSRVHNLESHSDNDTRLDLTKDINGSNIFNGRYSHLDQYRNENVNSIVSKGVDVPERLNSLIKERGLRGLTKECLEILSEMKKLKIPVTTETYNNCLIGCMKSNNSKLSRYLFLCLRSDILTPDLRTYTLMIKTHINSGDISSAFSLYKKMETEGTKADLVVFTVLIDCLVENRHLSAAWQLFNYMRTWRLIEPDEVLFTIMIKACVFSREAEKALNLYQEMLTLNKYPTIYTYTELINCLSNRKEYFNQCFQFYNSIKSQEYPINEKIITYLLRSCCSVGNSRKARELLIESSNMKIKPTLEMYIIYIKTLAKQMKLNKLSDNEKINNINKTWSIVQTILSKNILMINQNGSRSAPFSSNTNKNNKLLDDEKNYNNLSSKINSSITNIRSNNNLNCSTHNSSTNSSSMNNNIFNNSSKSSRDNSLFAGSNNKFEENNINSNSYNSINNNTEENNISRSKNFHQNIISDENINNNLNTIFQKQHNENELQQEENEEQHHQYKKQREYFNNYSSSKVNNGKNNMNQNSDAPKEIKYAADNDVDCCFAASSNDQKEMQKLYNNNNAADNNFNESNENILSSRCNTDSSIDNYFNLTSSTLKSNAAIVSSSINGSISNKNNNSQENRSNNFNNIQDDFNTVKKLLDDEKNYNNLSSKINSSLRTSNNMEENIIGTDANINNITEENNNINEESNINNGINKDITRLLNSVILVYENANYYDYAIEVLKCFDRFNAKPDYMTYFILLRMLGPKMKDPGRFFALWNQAKTEIEPQKTLLCMALDMAILSRSAKRTLEILNDMYNAKVFPTHNLMKKLYESGKRITQIHVMINNLVTLQRKITYEEKLNENKILQTYIDEHELNKHLVPENQL